MDLRTLSLFSGGLGLDRGVALATSTRTVCYVEYDNFCQALIQARVRDGSADDAPIWSDAKTFDGRPWRGGVDLVIGGPPCQPVSAAGRQRGADDDRWLWPDTIRIVAEAGPTLVFFENPGNITRHGLDGIIEQLCNLGYETAARFVTAEEVGAPHRRERIFILGARQEQFRDVALAHSGTCSEGQRPRPGQATSGRAYGRPSGPGRVLADPVRGGCGGQPVDAGRQAQPRTAAERTGAVLPAFPPFRNDTAGWSAVLAQRPDFAPALPVEPRVRRVADELAGGEHPPGPTRAKRIRVLGNGVVSLQAAHALRMLAHDLGIARDLGVC